MLDLARTLEALIRARIAIRESREYLAGDPGAGGGGLPGGAVDTAVQGFHAVPRYNPNHDPSSGEFSSGGGAGGGKMAGKHATKRARRKLRRKKEQLRRWAKRTKRELKANRRHAVHEHHQEAAHDRRSLKREHRDEIKGADREHASERKKLGKEQAKERETAVAEHGEDEAFHAKVQKDLAASKEHSPEDVAAASKRWQGWIEGKRAEHKEGLADMHTEHQQAHKELAENHADTKAEMAKDHARTVKAQAKQQGKDLGKIEKHHDRAEAKFKQTLTDRVGKMKKEVADADAGGKRSASGSLGASPPARNLGRSQRADGCGIGRGYRADDLETREGTSQGCESQRRLHGSGADAGARDYAGRRLSPYRLHKAGNAESILRACLRQLGWTARYRRGELTGRQHLALLEAVRQYGRAWLRHEAEQFANHYLGLPRGIDGAPLLFADHDGALRADRVAGGGESSVSRKIQWEPGPGGFLVEVERPGFTAHVGRFFRRAKAFIGEVITAGVMSLLGPAPLTKDDLEAAERETQKQTQFFDRFHDEIKHNPPAPRVPPAPIDPTKAQVILVVPPPMTPGQFIARVEKYADSTHQAAQRVNRHRAVVNPRFKVERRILGHPRTEHCEDCPPLAAMGWQPTGTLPDIGDSECGPLCLCHFEYADNASSQPHIQGNKGPTPAPAEAPEALPDDDEIHMIAEPPGSSLLVPIAGPAK